MEDAFIALMTPQSLVGLGLILLGAYLWFTKVRNEGTVGSEFKELIEQLQSQIILLRRYEISQRRTYPPKLSAKRPRSLIIL